MDKKVKSALICLFSLTAMVVFTIILVAQNRQNDTSKLNPAGVKQERKALYTSGREDSLVAFAKTLLGTPYLYASSSPSGFDCSGFVYYVFKKFNVDISRSSYTIGEKGKEVDSSEAKKGDIILFQGTDLSDPKIGHVGIVISQPGFPIEFIHSSSSTSHNGVVINKLTDGHYQKRFIKVIRIDPLK